MEGKVEQSEIEEKTPFTEHLAGRVIPTGFIYDPDHDNSNLPEFTDDQDWLNFLPGKDGEIRFFIGEPIEGVYFGKEAEDEKDLNFTFLEVYYQYLTWPDIVGVFPQLIDDIRNLAASLSTLAVYQSELSESGPGIARLVQRELEYLFFVARSMYDGLQFVAANTWEKIHSTTDDSDYSAQLPSGSFKDMALDGNDPISASTLKEKYGLIDGLANFYADEAPTFLKLRNFRDAVVHLGESPERIFTTEDGLAVDVTTQPFSEFDVWDDDQINENDLAPLWPFVAYIIDHTFSALDRFVSGLLEDPLHLPPKLAEDYEVFIRGPHIPNLKSLDDLMGSDQWGQEFVESVENNYQL